MDNYPTSPERIAQVWTAVLTRLETLKFIDGFRMYELKIKHDMDTVGRKSYCAVVVYGAGCQRIEMQHEALPKLYEMLGDHIKEVRPALEDCDAVQAKMLYENLGGQSIGSNTV